MALQDLTPQLRTRLSRMERAVGWFVVLAVALLAFGFGYYLHSTAQRKGWFKTKVPYFTFTDRATGLRVGDPVDMMGMPVGQITKIEPQPPDDFYFNIYVEFEIVAPYQGYLWTEGSRAKVATADFLGKRVLEVTKGTGGYPTYVFNPVRDESIAALRQQPDLGRWLLGEEILEPHGTNILAKAKQPLTPEILAAAQGANLESLVVLDQRETRKTMTGVWNDKKGRYMEYTRTTKPYWLLSDESPAVTERLERVIGQVERAIPSILSLTNQLTQVLSNSATLTLNLNEIVLSARPALSNLAAATAGLDRPGGLGEWLLPTNLNARVDQTLGAMTGTLTGASNTLNNANTNLAVLVDNLNRSLDNLASMTSNLNQQVQVNTNILSSVSDAIVHADQFIQGLKHHWLLRSAFRDKSTNAPPGSPDDQLKSPKEKARGR